jgi:hypothetical protein
LLCPAPASCPQAILYSVINDWWKAEGVRLRCRPTEVVADALAQPYDLCAQEEAVLEVQTVMSRCGALDCAAQHGCAWIKLERRG